MTEKGNLNFYLLCSTEGGCLSVYVFKLYTFIKDCTGTLQ